MDLTNRCDRRPKSVNSTLPLSIVNVASAFGWSSWKQWRTTGDTGLRMGQSGFLTERMAGALFVASFAATLATSRSNVREIQGS